MNFYLKILLAGLFLTPLFANPVQGQKAPECVKVAKANRPNWLLLENKDLDRFYLNFDGGATFTGMKLVKTELAYYLLARPSEGEKVYAFELEQKKNKLFLNRYFPVHTCDPGDLTLDTFLQKAGKIVGCRTAKHEVRQLSEKKK